MSEMFEEIRQRVRNEKYTFWFSQKHADHYRHINQYEHDEDEKVCKNFADIDGKLIPYTCCTTRPDATEPFEGALETFPDYVKVAEGKISNIRMRGNW